jgi:hypothetical protein
VAEAVDQTPESQPETVENHSEKNEKRRKLQVLKIWTRNSTTTSLPVLQTKETAQILHTDKQQIGSKMYLFLKRSRFQDSLPSLKNKKIPSCYPSLTKKNGNNLLHL